MKGVSKNEFLTRYLRALEDGDAALFAGAGLSRTSGFVDWAELLRDIAEDLGLSVERETDLVALAQFHANSRGSRARIDEVLIEEFTKDARPTETHDLIASLPLRAVWTTNYDQLIERAYEAAGKRADIKIRQDDLKRSLPRRDVVVYKMHGDVMSPSEAVLTKEDYETYGQTRPLFTEVLTGDLVEKTFLFAGFSFADPNISYVLGRVRGLLGQQPREHYWIVRPELPQPKLRGARKADHEYRIRRQELQIADLRRYGVQPVIIDDYREVEEIFRTLSRSSHRDSVFVSGSAHEFGEMGRERVEALSYELGREIIRRGYRLVSGLGLGIGGTVTLGAFDELYRGDGDVGERTLLRPFPQTPPAGMTREAFWTRYRQDIIGQAGFAIFMSGNKSGAEGTTVSANGVRQEFELAVERGLFPVPIGATGYVAREIWGEVTGDLSRFYPGGGVAKHFQTLGDLKASNDDLLSAAFSIIERARKRPGL